MTPRALSCLPFDNPILSDPLNPGPAQGDFKWQIANGKIRAVFTFAVCHLKSAAADEGAAAL
jgi:hypothetical protein